MSWENEKLYNVEEQDETNIDELNEGNEEIEDSEELEHCKNVKSFNAEGNRAQNQIFVQDIGNGGFTINYYLGDMQPVTKKASSDKTYDLRKQQDCIEFVENYNDSDFFVVAFILCVFEGVIMSDIAGIKACIENSDNKRFQKNENQDYLYTALNTIFATIEACKSTTKNGEQCISIGEKTYLALLNMLEQFPTLQDLFFKFVVSFTEKKKYHTLFYDFQLAASLAKIYSANIMDIKNDLLPELFKNIDNVYLLGKLICELHYNNEKESTYILEQCMEETNLWEWRVVVFSYVLFNRNRLSFPYEREVRRLLWNKIIGRKKSDYKFLAQMLLASKAFRNMICEVYEYAYRNSTYERQKEIAQNYIFLVRRCYYQVNLDYMELPMVACDSLHQQECLVDVLKRVMSEYRLRKQMYAILAAYLRELAEYEPEERVINHIAVFCCNLSSDDVEFQEDLLEALDKCHGIVAKKVIKKVIEIL